MKRVMYTPMTDNLIAFGQCPSCKAIWPTRGSFLADPGVRLIGYSVNFTDLLAGVFLFRHRCEAIVTIHAGEFASLYDGPVFGTPQTGGPKCPGYCLRADELRSCPAHCECAFVREIIQLIANWPKRPEADSPALTRSGRSS